MSRLAVLSLITLPLLAIPSIASAQVAIEVDDAAFPTMGPDGHFSNLGAQLMFLMPDGGPDDSLKRIDVQGQYIGSSGAGGYFTIAASHAGEANMLGSLEAGAVFHRAKAQFDYAVRVGLVLPTGAEGESGSVFVHWASSIYSRPNDYVSTFGEFTALRVAFSPSVRRGNFVARADVGLDVILDGDGDRTPKALHADLGAGFHNGKGGVIAELSSFAFTEDLASTMDVIALTGELTEGKTTPYLTISRPFNTIEETDGSLFGDDVIVLNIGAGIRGQL